jgi:hypothetical protein
VVTDYESVRQFSADEATFLSARTGPMQACRGTPLEALRRSFDIFAEEFAADRGRWLALITLTRTTPAIRARHLDKQDRWLDAMSAAMAARMGVPEQDNRPRIFCAVALAAADAELIAFSAEDDETRIHAALDRAIGAIRELAGHTQRD